jgi:hypothetical protein|tara:strand:- start:430 stop:555 length:126 start_codon:yes stop_codon:yes gene_type:complete
MAYKTKNRTAGKSVKAKKKKPIPAKKRRNVLRWKQEVRGLG